MAAEQNVPGRCLEGAQKLPSIVKPRQIPLVYTHPHLTHPAPLSPPQGEFPHFAFLLTTYPIMWASSVACYFLCAPFTIWSFGYDSWAVFAKVRPLPAANCTATALCGRASKMGRHCASVAPQTWAPWVLACALSMPLLPSRTRRGTRSLAPTGSRACGCVRLAPHASLLACAFFH